MRSPCVLVVEHEDGTGPAYLGERLAANDFAVSLVRPYLGEQLPATLDGHDGLVVLGGTPGPFDDHVAGWLPQVRGLMAEALTREVPLLGICLGGELLADVAGGRVVRAADGPELGLHEIVVGEAAVDDPLFGGLPPVVPAVEWHWEEIAELPPGATLLCSTDRFPHQAFRVGDTAWGTQFHPEVLTDSATAWAAHNPDDLHGAGLTVERVVADVADAEPDLRKVWGLVADRWCAVVHERRGMPLA